MKGLRDLRPFAGAPAVVFAVISVAFALRLNALHGEEPGPDGLISLALAREPWPLFLNFLLRDPHPPLYYLLLRGWLALTGLSVETARWISVAAGVAAVCMVVRLVQELGGLRARVPAALLFTLMPAAIFASASVRDYSLGLSLSLASLWLYPARRANASRPLHMVVLAFVTAAALLTWYFHMVILLLQAAFCAIDPKRRWALYGIVLGAVLASFWVTPSARYLLPEFLSATRPQSGVAIGELPVDTFAFWITRATIGDWLDTSSLRVEAGLLVGVTLGSWAVLASMRNWRALTVAVGGTMLALAVGYLSAWRWAGPIQANRAVLPAAFFLVLSCALAIGHLKGHAWYVGVGVMALILAPMMSVYQYRLGPYPYKDFPFVSALASRLQPGDAVLFTDMSFRAAYDVTFQSQARDHTLFTVNYLGTHVYLDEVEQSLTLILSNLARATRVWFVSNLQRETTDLGEGAKAEEIVMAHLLAQFMLHEAVTLGDGTTIRRFGPEPALIPEAVEALFDRTYLLEAAAVPRAVAAGDTLSIVLTWKGLGPPQGDYSVFVHLRDMTHRTVAQADGWPASGLRPTSSWKVGEQVIDAHVVELPRDLPVGTYQVIVGLYDARGRLTLSSDAKEVGIGLVRVQLDDR